MVYIKTLKNLERKLQVFLTLSYIRKHIRKGNIYIYIALIQSTLKAN